MADKTAAILLFGWEALLVPAAPAAVHGDRVLVPHLLQIVGSESRAEAAAAVEDHFLVLVRDRGFDVAFDDAFAEVDRTLDVPLRPLAIFADVDQGKLFARVHALFDF